MGFSPTQRWTFGVVCGWHLKQTLEHIYHVLDFDVIGAKHLCVLIGEGRLGDCSYQTFISGLSKERPLLHLKKVRTW